MIYVHCFKEKPSFFTLCYSSTLSFSFGALKQLATSQKYGTKYFGTSILEKCQMWYFLFKELSQCLCAVARRLFPD